MIPSTTERPVRRFSEGLEREPRAASVRRAGSFGDGLRHDGGSPRAGSFADGMAATPPERVGTFADRFGAPRRPRTRTTRDERMRGAAVGAGAA